MANFNSINNFYNTAKLLKSTFGSNEFTTRDYNERIHNDNEDTFCFGTIVKNYANELVKRTRIEEFVAHDEDGEAFVAKRYHYIVNPNIDEAVAKETKNMVKLAKETIKNTNCLIDDCKAKINDYYERIDKMKKFIAENS